MWPRKTPPESRPTPLVRHEETGTQEQVLARGGIVAGEYGTPNYAFRGEPTMRQRAPQEAKLVSAATSRQMQRAHPIERQPVTISHRDDAHGAGAFWDHFTVRNATDRRTDITHDSNVKPTLSPSGINVTGQYTGRMPGDEPDSGSGPGRGLLLITGGNIGLVTETPRNKAHIPNRSAVERNDVRSAHEKDLLKKAQNTGRPVLGICGGSWRVLESFGGSTLGVDPNTHQTKKMPYLTTKGNVAKVATEHPVDVFADTMLHSAFRDDNRNTPARVNSAHWAVARESSPGRLHGVPSIGSNNEPLLAVSARGRTGTVAPYIDMNAAGTSPHIHSVEAFETRHGAPQMGIQWHPEAYDSGFGATDRQANRNLLRTMAQAGDAYEARRDTTAYFQKWVGTSRLQPRYLAGNKAFQLARRNAKL